MPPSTRPRPRPAVKPVDATEGGILYCPDFRTHDEWQALPPAGPGRPSTSRPWRAGPRPGSPKCHTEARGLPSGATALRSALAPGVTDRTGGLYEHDGATVPKSDDRLPRPARALPTAAGRSS